MMCLHLKHQDWEHEPDLINAQLNLKLQYLMQPKPTKTKTVAKKSMLILPIEVLTNNAV